jgi:transposase InsO family protein
MVRDVRKWVKKCIACVKRKTSQVKQGLMQIRTYVKPWDTVGIDLIGPFPETRTGYKYVLTVTDFFSHYTIVTPLPNKSAKTVAYNLFNQVICVHSCPRKFMSDRGTEFLNPIINELCQLLSIKKVYTSAYRPQANGGTERVHRFINDCVSMYITKFEREWDLWIHASAFVHNTSVITGTQGLTPFFLIFGREPVLPTDVMLSPVVVVPQNQETYAQELITRLSKAHGYMAAITQELRQKQKEYYDLGRKSIKFDVGDLVVVRRPQKSGQSGIAAKWLPRWSGPYRIVERMPNDDNYRLEHVETGKLLDPTNVDKLIKVEPWAAEQPNSEESIPNNGEDTSPENPLSRSDEQYENGTFIVYEKLGDILDDDVKLMIEELFDWLKVQNNHKSSTGEACKHLYAKNPQYKKILQSIGGIRQLLIHTPSILFEMPNATGGNNALKLLDASQPLKYHLDRLGGRYGIGRVTHYYEDEDVYELELWDRKSKKTKWNKPLRPVKLEEEFATELVQSKRILCSIELDDKFKIGKTAEKQLEDLQLLLVCYNNSCFPCTSCTF